jgi:hypothetical protein
MATASKEEIIAYHEGIKEGLWRHAHWLDGVQYVGNMGTTLKEATAKVEAECEKALGSIK